MSDTEPMEPWSEDAVRSALSRAQAFGPGPFEIHVHPDEADEIRAHQTVLDEYGAVVVPDEEQKRDHLSTSRRPS